MDEDMETPKLVTFQSTNLERRSFFLKQTRTLIDMFSLILTLVAVGLSPLYLWRSGMPQVSHILMCLALILQLTRKRLSYQRWWSWGGYFVAYTTIVNLLVFGLHRDIHTAMSSSYYLFNFLVWGHLLTLSRKTGPTRFLRSIERVLWSILLIESIVVFTGLGRMFGSSRATGTFNDPNQMAHWFVWMGVLLTATGWALHKSLVLGALATALATAGVAFSASRSGALGLLPLLLTQVVLAGRKSVLLLRGRVRCRLIGATSLLLLVLIGAAGLLWGTYRNSSPIYLERLKETFSDWLERFHHRDQYFSLEGRGYDRLWKFPEYLLFGAGEGANHRWADRTWFLGEIHSTFAGVLFYYGFPGFISLVVFLHGLWRRLGSATFKLLALSPLLYSLGTYNLRNWFFGIGLSILYLSAQHCAYSQGH